MGKKIVQYMCSCGCRFDKLGAARTHVKGFMCSERITRIETVTTETTLV